jgi:serine protease Do
MPVNGFGEIAEKLRRSTVLVHAGSRGSGSGVIWTSDGSMITNAHVARTTQVRVQLWDGRDVDATVASRDLQRDLAVLHAYATNLPAVSVADSSQVRPGELAIAIGNPLGFVGALTTGLIHTVGPLRGLGSRIWVQADVRLAPGNSGGPLADAAGRVIGINTMIAGGLALAIPSNVVQDFLSSGPSHAWLGVTVHPVRIPCLYQAGEDRASGLALLEVAPGSPASCASLSPGDILLGTGQKAFTSVSGLSQALQGTGPRLLRLEYLRGDYSRVRRVTVQLGRQTAPEGAAAA